MSEAELYNWGAQCRRCEQHLPYGGGDFCVSCQIKESELKEDIEKLDLAIEFIKEEIAKETKNKQENY